MMYLSRDSKIKYNIMTPSSTMWRVVASLLIMGLDTV